jgi:hypothetical protein
VMPPPDAGTREPEAPAAADWLALGTQVWLLVTHPGQLAEPELDEGAEEDDRIVPDDEPLVPEDEPLVEPPEVVCDDDPGLVLADVPAALDVLCVELGRVKASPPATATPSTPAPAVAARSRPRARSRFTTAVTVRGSLLFILTPSRKLAPLTFPQRSMAGLSTPSAATLNTGYPTLAAGLWSPAVRTDGSAQRHGATARCH